MKYVAILGLVIGMGTGLSQTDAQASNTVPTGQLVPLVMNQGQTAAKFQPVYRRCWWNSWGERVCRHHHRHWRHW